MRATPDRDAAVYDAVVIGGGPAGAVAGSLLASWGRRVAILHRPDRPSHAIAETIPPSTRRLLESIGVLAEIDRARFCRTGGNTSWWGGRPRQVESYAAGKAGGQDGYQVWRPALDALLLEHARGAGARVESPAVVRLVQASSAAADGARLEYIGAAGQRRQVTGRFALDASGRAGVIARKGFRIQEPGFATVAVCGRWRRDDGWSADLEDETHTTVETTDAGWVWSIPVSARQRSFTVMVDRSCLPRRREGTLAARYRTWLAQAPHSARLLDRARADGPVFARAASLYTARRFADGPFLLVGDAGSFIDPLSSYGVKKALASAWRAAAVVNTALAHPERADAAFALFDSRERTVYESYLAQSSAFFTSAANAHGTPYWTERARVTGRASAPQDPIDGGVTRDPDVHRALAALRSAPRVSLRRTDGLRIDVRPEFAEREVVMAEWLVGPRVTHGLRYNGRVELPRLLALADGRGDVGDVLEAYRRHDPHASVQELLSGLALLVGKGLLENAAI